MGEKRYIFAQTDYEADYGRLLAFGLSKAAISALAEKSQPLGEYTLVAANAGAVLSDDFHQGQRVESGQALMELADERELWVEARLAPTFDSGQRRLLGSGQSGARPSGLPPGKYSVHCCGSGTATRLARDNR